jgi:hypothetical protein
MGALKAGAVDSSAHRTARAIEYFEHDAIPRPKDRAEVDLPRCEKPHNNPSKQFSMAF